MNGSDGYVQVKVDHLRHLEIFLNRMVEQGTHVHAKCWALVAAIPESADRPVGSTAEIAPPDVHDSLPIAYPEPVFNEDGFGAGFRVVHPPGVECVFPPNTKQCSCGKMDLGVTPPLSDPASTEQSPSQS